MFSFNRCGKLVFTCLALLLGFTHAAAGQESSPKKRPFDAFPGLVVAVQSEGKAAWNTEAVTYLLAEVKRRAAAAKLPVSVQPAAKEWASQKLGLIDGFNADKAVRMVLRFQESTKVKGQVEFTLASSVVWEPTAKEIPNAKPGQRIVQNFFSQSATFDLNTSFKAAEPSLKDILETFFDLGEGKL